jgi:ribosomal protein S18 acetylase RimI-like enzyme
MKLNIRSASEADEPAVVALWHACGLVVTYNNPQTDFRLARAKTNSDVLVGTAADGTIVGSVMVGHDGHRGWLYYVAVALECRKQGIGRSMVQAAEDWLSRHGIAKAQLMVRETNAEVVAFYEQLGFQNIPRTVMQKWLRTEASD